MYLSELQIQNFRAFGGAEPFTLPFKPGVTALVGENDAGKTAIIDAIRYALLSRDVDFVRIQEEDFHLNAAGHSAREIILRCKLSDLSHSEQAAFVEHLTYEGDEIVLYIHWRARKLGGDPGSRRWVDVSAHSGKEGGGPVLESAARQLLATTYLKPLRDAERELSPGRGSRLSQILGSVEDLKKGKAFDPEAIPGDLAGIDQLSLLGLFDFMRSRMDRREPVLQVQAEISDRHLRALTLRGDGLQGRIRFTDEGSPEVRFRRLLERLELSLSRLDGHPRGTFGLGSNNLLFIACELLLLGKENEGLPLLLVEEPEAHLHPQRQLRLMQFLSREANPTPGQGQRPVQVILTTHSPNLASQIPLANLVMVKGSTAYPLTPNHTRLNKGDYSFLERFLDITKANLFFARGVLIVEGDAEAILLPTLARLVGLDLTERGVSIVNVGGTGLRRFSRIFQRKEDGRSMDIPVACVTDMDVMPDCAPEILELQNSKRRRWKKRSDYGKDPTEQDIGLDARRRKLSEGDGQGIRTFVADHWTLEFDLALGGLAQEVFFAAWLAKNDDPLNENRKDRDSVLAEAAEEWVTIQETVPEDPVRCAVHIYKLFQSNQVSKAIAAQHLAALLEESYEHNEEGLLWKLPPYLRDALAHVTGEALEVSVAALAPVSEVPANER